MEPVSICFALLNLGLRTATATGLIRTRADRALESLDDKVASLIAQPLHEGLARLEQAAGSVNADLRTTLLGEARAKFTDVLARPAAPVAVRVAAATALTACWWNLDQPDLAREAVLRAVDLQRQAVDDLRAQWAKTNQHRTGWSSTASGSAAAAGARAAATAFVLPLGLTGYRVKELVERQADSRRKALEAEMTLSDADTLLVLELAARTGADGMSRATDSLKSRMPALPA